MKTWKVAAAGLAVAFAGGAAAQSIGPSTITAPYLQGVAPGVGTLSIITVSNVNNQTLGTDVGTASNGYQFVGIPDGLGAFDNGNGTFTVLVNHELGNTSGSNRVHGSSGSFVSRLVVDKSSFGVSAGSDAITNLFVWNVGAAAWTNGAVNVPGTGAQLNRFCSADLPAVAALFNAATGKGTTNLLFFSGEETSPDFSPFFHGRQFATVVTGPGTGDSYELARLGKAAWENYLLSPTPQDLTVAIGMDDSRNTTGITNAVLQGQHPSELYMYVGAKQTTGNDVEKAGLNNGTLYGVKLDELGAGTAGIAYETAAFGFGSTSYVGKADFGFYTHPDYSSVSDPTGSLQQSNDIANTVTQFKRLEDGVWDPANSNVYYFVTTDNFGGTNRTRLFKMEFDDITNPTNGGTVEILINGYQDNALVQANTVGRTNGPQMMDNITAVVGNDGVTRLLIQEDIGNNNDLGAIWMYDTSTSNLVLIAQHNPQFFTTNSPTGSTNFITRDEESSGIIPVWDILGDGWFLATVQAHRAIGGELVEQGQLVALYIPQAIPEPGTILGLLAAAGLAVAARRRSGGK